MAIYGPQKSRSLNGLLALASFFWLGLVAFLFAQDVWRTHQIKIVNESERLAAKSLREVEDTGSGWFPAQTDPIFDWEGDEQGWVLEEDDPNALAPVAVYEGASEPIPEKKPAADSGKRLHVVDTGDKAHGRALAVPVHFPDPATVFRDNIVNTSSRFKMQGVRFISYDVFLPKDCGGYVSCLFFMKDKDGLWYQARAKNALLPGRWNTLTADIRGGSADVTPLGHLGQWDENQASRIRTIGLTLYGDQPFGGTLLVDNFRGWLRPQRFTRMVAAISGPDATGPARLNHLRELAADAAKRKEEPVRVINFRVETPFAAPATGQPQGEAGRGNGAPGNAPAEPALRQFETLTLRFELNRQVDNPFDPEKADLACQVTAPSGKTQEHIAFWYQDYDRADRFQGDELIPLGRPEWRVRITPRETGKYKYVLTVKLRNSPASELETLTLPPGAFVSLPSEDKGFVRVSSQDPRFFEFENGAFFYPVGHNLHSPVDIRCWKEIFQQAPPAGRGLPMYAKFFDKMQQNGENLAEVWMSAWWLAIEWTSQWRDYYGPLRYSLQHAWLLDNLLAMAAKQGLLIHLVLDNHGKFSSWCDWEWDLNPYNKNCEPNGVVGGAPDFFTDETARKWHRDKLRYIAARWGSSPTLMGWELVSEYDLVGGRDRNDNGARSYFHRSPVLQAWAKEMINHLRACDAYQHPITNHYATDYKWVDVQLASSPFFDYVVTDAYRADRPYTGIALNTHAWATQVLGGRGSQKPFWITEFGGDWNATTSAALEADDHCGLWATWMTDGAGTPLFWWYDFLDANNLYSYYRAFSNYIRGEDRRSIQGVLDHLNVTAGNETSVLTGRVYRWEKGAYVWLYDNTAMQNMPAARDRTLYKNAEAVIPGLAPGGYRIEYWNCYTGQIVQTAHVTVTKEDPLLRLKFPTFTNDMAVKAKREKE